MGAGTDPFNIDARQNSYFNTYGVDLPGGGGFSVQTNGINATAEAGISVILTQTPGGEPPTITITGT